MYIVQVQIHVESEFVDEFVNATIENARSSVLEAGVARFDVLQDLEDPTQFLLVEVYRSPDAPAHHKETSHYQVWRDTVARMMAAPRVSSKFINLFPDEAGW